MYEYAKAAANFVTISTPEPREEAGVVFTSYLGPASLLRHNDVCVKTKDRVALGRPACASRSLSARGSAAAAACSSGSSSSCCCRAAEQALLCSVTARVVTARSTCINKQNAQY